MSMMMTPESLSGNHTVDFRAPPPSPVGPGRKSPFSNEDVLTEFLNQSLKVPDLVLPDRAFPRQKPVQNPPVLDFDKLEEIESGKAREMVELIGQKVGCFEVINHGISRDFVKLMLDVGAGVFEISGEKKRLMARTTERGYGFEEIHGEEEIGSARDESEEFVWCGDEAARSEMDRIWPLGYPNFSGNMEKLSAKIEEIGVKILTFLQRNSSTSFGTKKLEQEPVARKLCHIHKHSRTMGGDQSENSLRYDVIRTLIRGSEFPHALCLHICSGATEFHVYSKKGWVSFVPTQDSIVVTVGDKLQEWTGGKYKQVLGRPVFRSKDEKQISMGFLYLPSQVTSSIKDDNSKTVSVTQQIIISDISTPRPDKATRLGNSFSTRVFSPLATASGKRGENGCASLILDVKVNFSNLLWMDHFHKHYENLLRAACFVTFHTVWV